MVKNHWFFNGRLHQLFQGMKNFWLLIYPYTNTPRQLNKMRASITTF